MDTKHIKIQDFNYDLPDEKIAKFPLSERDHSKLLIFGEKNGDDINEDVFYNLPSHLPKGELMVFNNTKVIQARLRFHKETGAMIEVFCLEPAEPNDYVLNFQATSQCTWYCMVGNLKKWKEGVLSMTLSEGNRTVVLHAERIGEKGTSQIVRFTWEGNYSFAEVLDIAGELPIPPYLNRETQESDKRTYQTVYSKIKGSVAAPTAGLHFTEKVLNEIDSCGIERNEITLHVGAGTFKPVKSKEIEGHEMHSEYIVVSRESIEKLIKHNGKAIAVGTTSVRTLESLYYIGCKLHNNPDASEEELHVNQWEPYEQEEKDKIDTVSSLKCILDYLTRHSLPALHTSTQIIIAPGYKYHIVKWMVTNFHQPQSTLLLLVSAFIGDDWKKVYDYALANNFRFLSYGDSNLFFGK